MPSHRPVVGSALNWQGQPQLQLQLTTCSPAIRHLILVGVLIFLLRFTAYLAPNRAMSRSVKLQKDYRPIYSASCHGVARFHLGCSTIAPGRDKSFCSTPAW